MLFVTQIFLPPLAEHFILDEEASESLKRNRADKFLVYALKCIDIQFRGSVAELQMSCC